MLPVLVTVMVAVTGFPAGSTVLGECGIPLLVTDGAANEIEPVNGSLRCEPSTGSATSSTRVHRPCAGEPMEELHCRARGEAVVGGRLHVQRLAVRIDQEPFKPIVGVGKLDAEVQRRLARRAR